MFEARLLHGNGASLEDWQDRAGNMYVTQELIFFQYAYIQLFRCLHFVVLGTRSVVTAVPCCSPYVRLIFTVL